MADSPKLTKTGRPRKKPGPAKKAERMKQKAELQERRKKALEMRTAGVPWATIVLQLGYADEGHLSRDMSQALAEITIHSAEEYRKMQLRALERYQLFTDGMLKLPQRQGNAVIPLTENEHKLNLIRVRTGLKVQERIADLLGLDAPVKMEHSGMIEGLDIKKLDETQLAAIREGKPLPPPALPAAKTNGAAHVDDEPPGPDSGVPGSLPLDETDGGSGDGTPPPQTPPH